MKTSASATALRNDSSSFSALRKWLLILPAFALAMAGNAQAATDTWTTGSATYNGVTTDWGAANLNTSSNWTGTAPPVTGDSLVFGTTAFNFNGNASATPVLTDDLMTPGTFTIAGITFATSGAGKVVSYTINPVGGTNGFTLTTGITNSTTYLQTINEQIALSGTNTFSMTTGGGNILLGGIVSGTGGALTTAGAGTLTLSANSTYTGATTIASGTTLQLGAGGTTGSLSGTSSIANSGTLTINRSNAVSQATDLNNNIITGGGGFTQAGSGTTTLSLANSYTGATTVNGGTLALSGSLASTSLVLGGGTFNYAATSATQGFTTTTLNAGGGGVSAAAGNTLNLGTITRNAGGTVNVGNTGTITAINANTNGILGGYATFGGTAFAVSGGNGTTAGAFTGLSSYDQALTTAGDATTTHNDNLATGLASLAATSINTLTITDSTSGDTLALGANNLTFTYASATSLGGLLYAGGSNYTISGTGVVGGTTNTSELVVNVSSGGNLTISAPVVSATVTAGSLTVGGGGTLTLTGINTSQYTGATTIGSGTTLTIGGSGSLGDGIIGHLAPGTYAGNIADAGTFNYTSTATQTLSGQISGTGNITVNGSGTLITNNPLNTYGNLNILSGTFQTNDGTGTGGATSNRISGGATATELGSGAITIGQASGTVGTLTLNTRVSGGDGANNYFINNPFVVNGNGSGTDTIQITTFNSILTGPVTLNNANLTLIANNGGGSVLEFTGGITGTGNVTLKVNGTGGGSGGSAVVIGLGGINNTGTITNSGTVVAPSVITGVVGANVTGVFENSANSGLQLFGANTYTADTTVTAGTLTLTELSGTSSLAAQYSTINLNGGTVAFGAATTSATIGGLGGSVGGGNAGNLNLGAVNLTIGNSNVSYAGNTLNPTYSGVLSGTGKVTKVGTNTQTFSGANTYSGATSVNAGTLNLTGSNVNSTTTVNSTGTLTGTGTAGPLILNNGGTIAPGNGTTPSTLTAANLTWNSAATESSTLSFVLDGASTNTTKLSLAGGFFNKGTTGGAFDINLTDTSTLSTIGTYDLVDFTGGSTNFVSGDFTQTGSLTYAAGFSGSLVLTGTQLDFVVVPEPGTWAMMLGGFALLVVFQRRKSKS